MHWTQNPGFLGSNPSWPTKYVLTLPKGINKIMCNRRCESCSRSNSCYPDLLSDFCDDCQCDSDTGFGGFTDHSYVDDYGESLHFNSQREADIFYDIDELFNVFG